MKFQDSDSRPDPAKIEQLFHAALELPAEEQDAFLATECGEQSDLREAVRRLLAAARDAVTAWDHHALDLEARHSAFEARQVSPGEFFGPYRILRRIAAGGMSLVYEG